MTEDEWLTGADPIAMLDYLGKKKSVRKRQRFCLACWAEARDVFGNDNIHLNILEEYSGKDWFDQDDGALDVGEIYRNVEDDLTSRFWDQVQGGEGEIMEAWRQGTQATLTSWDAGSIRAAAVLTATLTALFSPSSAAPVTMFDFDEAEAPTAAELAKRIEADAAAAGKQALARWRKYQKTNADLVREVSATRFARSAPRRSG